MPLMKFQPTCTNRTELHRQPCVQCRTQVSSDCRNLVSAERFRRNVRTVESGGVGGNACEWRSYSTDINLRALDPTARVAVQAAVFASYVTLGKFVAKAESQTHKSKSANSQ